MNSRRFHQAGMKKCQVGNEEMEAELMQEANAGDQDFRYGIAKIRKDCENFAMIAKILQS